MKKDLKGDHNAKEVSDALPFIEYEIHRQLINKLKVKGMNALFGLKTKLSISDRTIIGTATATGCYLTALPSPSHPKLLCSNSWQQNDPNYLQKTRQRLEGRISENRNFYGVNDTEVVKRRSEMGMAVDEIVVHNVNDTMSDNEDDPSGNVPDADFGAGNKDTSVLEVKLTSNFEFLSNVGLV